jgi:cytochrome c-type biogenesis protein CcmH/NrfF
VKRTFQLLVVCATVVVLMGADNHSARYDNLGSKIMCSCGCGQMLLKCNHVGCPNSAKMLKQLKAEVDKTADRGTGDRDEDVLNFFRREWGMTVVVEPSQHGFELLAWILPFAGLGIGFCLMVLVVRKWRFQPSEINSSDMTLDPHFEALREIARRDTEL